MNAVGYVRVSTDKQTDRGVSLEAQAERIRAMAVVHNAELIDIIVDGGESAKSLQCPGHGSPTCARWRRNCPGSIRRQVGSANAQREGFVRTVGALRAARCRIDLSFRIFGHKFGCRLVLNIMTAVSQWEREAIGERTRDTLDHKLRNGERVGNIRFGLSPWRRRQARRAGPRRTKCPARNW